MERMQTKRVIKEYENGGREEWREEQEGKRRRKR
jgi:hypothetical protein